MRMMRKLSSVTTSKSDVSNRDRIYSGYLHKQGSMFNKKFQKRYFVLYEGKILVYYISENDTEHKGEINLSHVLSINETDMKVNDGNSTYSNIFEITTKDRTYILSAPDIKSMNAWIDFIRSCVFGTKIHSGWMTKQGDFVKSWKRRYFVLTSTKLLRYFEDEEQQKFKGIINVSNIISIKEGEPIEPYWNYIIHLQTHDRLWLLNADSEIKRQEWLKMLDEGKKTINYDANAALFVDIIQNYDKCKERIKYIFDIYKKWCISNNQFEYKKDLQNNINNKHIKSTSGFKSASSDKSKGIYEILNNDLKDYSNVALLNDFNFLLYNSNNRDIFIKLHRYMLGSNISQPSIPPEQSLLLMRNMRDKLFYGQYSLQRKMLFNNNENIKDINATCLIDRIYSYLIYSYNILMLTPVQWARIKDYDETDKLITSNKMLKSKRVWIKNAKQIFRINDRKKKFMIDVIEIKNENINEKNDEKQDEKEQKDDDDGFVEIPNNFNHLDVKFSNDISNENEYFEFGYVELLYWDEYRDNKWYIKCEYSNLKDELISNNLYCISIEQWNNLYETATNLSESDIASEYLSYDWLGENDNSELLVDKYGIYEYTQIKINHIVSILLYCNYYQFSQILISTYSILNKNETICEWKLRHGKLGNCSRYLRECCEVFGKLVTENDIFYYSINSDTIDFGKSLKINYNMPISMSRNLFVCQSYFEFDNYEINNKAGMLLSITKQLNTKSFYIDCGWCSDYPYEKEILLLSIYPNQSRIKSMIHISLVENEILFNNYQFYMSAMADLERMLNARKSSDTIGRNTKIALNEMIKYKFGGENNNENKNENENEEMKSIHVNIETNELKITNDNEEKKEENIGKKENENIAKKVRPKGVLHIKGKKINNDLNIKKKENEMTDIIFKLKTKRKQKIPQYIKQMFDEYCLNISNILIDFSLMVSLSGGYREWKDIFLNSDDTYFNILILIKLFPNLNKIQINYISQAFTKQTIKLLIECLKSKYIIGREIFITISRPNTYSNNMLFDEDNKGANIEDFSLKNALNKLNKSNIDEKYNWYFQLNDENENNNIPCIQIMRPHKAIKRNKNLSTILNEIQINKIQEILQNKITNNNWYLKLLYCGEKNKFDSIQFHKKCDGISHTISIIKSTNNFIFGGYTSKAWGRSGKWIEDKDAFLIQIQINNENNNPMKIINIKSGHQQYGMYLQSNGGPAFGKGDIKILNKCDKSSQNTCNSNSFTFDTKPINQLVGGKGKYFKVANYEVFQIAFY